MADFNLLLNTSEYYDFKITNQSIEHCKGLGLTSEEIDQIFILANSL